MQTFTGILDSVVSGQSLSTTDAMRLAGCRDLFMLMEIAARLRDQGHDLNISYSPKVFIPLTKLCRDVCHYCTFAEVPAKGGNAYLRPEEIISIARSGQAAGCHEALFTLGDKPELRYSVARRELQALGYQTTLEYLTDMASMVLDETGLLPHINAGVMGQDELLSLRRVSASQGLMLESLSTRLCEKGGPHFGSPDKLPQARLSTIAAAGRARVPFTSGILIGIGETRRERIQSLLALRDLNNTHGHLQEIIIQNFRRKPGTRMQHAPEPDIGDMLWTIAMARIIFGAEMNIQAPPNLMPEALPALIDAGINDWGGISPVTPDHVNPEAAWPQLDHLKSATEAAGKRLVARLPLYPAYIERLHQWLDGDLHQKVRNRIDALGYARTDNWHPGEDGLSIPLIRQAGTVPDLGSRLGKPIAMAMAGQRLSEDEIVRLFSARGPDVEQVCRAADELRKAVNGDVVTYVVNRNINYTNICYFGCRFCAFSKGKVSENLRERGYNLGLKEIQKRVVEAWSAGATEVCLQGGIHPDYTGETYLSIVRAIRQVQPNIHIHAFSPLEISHGAETLGLSVNAYLQELQQAGLASLPGTAAEILDDEIRAIICPDKINTGQWLDVIRTAHHIGMPTTATIMFGHVDSPRHWARHLLRIRDLQDETDGFTEFVPLPYIHMQAPLSKKGLARPGPTFRETLLMHAIARLVLHTKIDNIQASWVKLGEGGIRACLDAGVNDLGGTLMNESISRAAGSGFGQEFNSENMRSLIQSCGRMPRQRTTLYSELETESSCSA